ncbi:YggT family protein [Magnetofaba australis]|uniref:Putative YggT family protein n=1 Tax=Magnetofaba australis IT-1 TaxID=1434232 RepID=A0A1Y2JZV7_9PROT|nr:YggT family protein [Magnetofaba australis]OSM00447.1 putative YggT family protein [Magnetofaba australis IT-1]
MGIMQSIGVLLTFVLQIYFWMILIRVLMSWINPDPYNPIVQFLVRATDPVLEPCRRILPPIGGLDLSPMLALFAVSMLSNVIRGLFSGGDVGGTMFALGLQLLGFVHIALTLYMLLLLARGGVNIYLWMRYRQGRASMLDLRQPLNRFLFQATEPVTRRLRGFTPTVFGLDITPIVAALLTVLLLTLLEGLMNGGAAVAMGSGGGMGHMSY